MDCGPNEIGSSDFDIYRICEQQRLGRACAKSTQSRQSRYCSYTQRRGVCSEYILSVCLAPLDSYAIMFEGCHYANVINTKISFELAHIVLSTTYDINWD